MHHDCHQKEFGNSHVPFLPLLLFRHQTFINQSTMKASLMIILPGVNRDGVCVLIPNVLIPPLLDCAAMEANAFVGPDVADDTLLPIFPLVG